MKYVKLFEQFLYESALKDLYDKYGKKVAWVQQSKDIRSSSGDIDARERKFNIAARDNLFLHFSTKDDYDNDDIVMPPDVPIIYYGGGRDKESEVFMKNKKIVQDNLYNKRELLHISGNKVTFAETFEGEPWLPKTIFKKDGALKGDVGWPVIAKIKNGHSGLGIKKFDTKEELEKSKDEFDLFCQFIDFDREFRVIFCKDKIFSINERVPIKKDEKSIRTKDFDEKIRFVYVYQDLNKVDKKFLNEANKIAKDIQKKLPLDIWSLDVVVDKKGKLWVMETSSATGMGSVKMADFYRAVYEDFYGEKLPNDFLEDIYKKFVVTGHQNYYPEFKEEIESSPWAMDYKIITDSKYKEGYKYFFNIQD